MSTNLYKRLKALLPEAPVLTGTVTVLHADGMAEVAQDGGAGPLRVRNPLLQPSGARVYVQGGVITGPAPDLPYVLIEV